MGDNRTMRNSKQKFQCFPSVKANNNVYFSVFVSLAEVWE